MALFLATTKRLRLSNIQFENFTYKTEKTAIIDMLLNSKMNGRMFIMWEKEIDIPLEYIPDGATSISFEMWDKIIEIKEEKEFLIKGNEQAIVDSIMDKHKSEIIFYLIRNEGFPFATRKSKLEMKTWLLGEVGKGKITLESLKKMYFFKGTKLVTEKEYKETKEADNDKSN